jgi:hypothetical protein
VWKAKLHLKQKLKYPTVYGYLLLFVGFGSIVYLNLDIIGSDGIAISFSTNIASIIEAFAKLLWPIAVFFGIFILRNPLRNFIQHGKWEWDAAEKKLRYLGQQNSNTQSQDVISQISQVLTNEPEYIKPIIDMIKDHLNMSIGNETAKREEFLVSTLAKAAYREQFEAAYNRIFGSQLKALQHLRGYGKSALGFFFDEHKKQVGESEFGANTTPIFAQWLQFLIHYQFINLDGANAEITPIGTAFLEHIEKTYNLQKAF